MSETLCKHTELFVVAHIDRPATFVFADGALEQVSLDDPGVAMPAMEVSYEECGRTIHFGDWKHAVPETRQFLAQAYQILVRHGFHDIDS
jgi:hypothetical protein